MKEIYFSIDIETDGPIPAENSMLSIGVAAFRPDGTLVGTYSANLDTLPGAHQNSSTMAFWAKNQEAWNACRENTKDPKVIMIEFTNWVKEICKNERSKPVAVCYPAGFDFTFIQYYTVKFASYNIFSFSCIDIKTFAMAVLGINYKNIVKNNFPKRWFSKRPHTHIAIDDAIEQGELFINILKETRDNKV